MNRRRNYLGDWLVPNSLEEAYQFLKNGAGVLRIPFHLGEQGTSALCKYIEDSGTYLVALDLSGCEVANAGCTYVAKLLSESKSLHYLNLESNHIGDYGAVALAQALLHNESLEKLWLHDNRISDVGAIAFVHALVVRNRTLTSLTLSSNFTLKLKTVRAFRILVTLNKNITELRFSYKQTAPRRLLDSIYNQMRSNNDKDLAIFQQGLKQALKDGKAKLMRSKLMVIGYGKAGKTSTVRSLLGKPFHSEWKSTIGAEITQIETIVQKGVKNDAIEIKEKTDFSYGFSLPVAARMALKQKSTSSPIPQRLPDPQVCNSFNKILHEQLHLLHSRPIGDRRSDLPLSNWENILDIYCTEYSAIEDPNNETESIAVAHFLTSSMNESNPPDPEDRQEYGPKLDRNQAHDLRKRHILSSDGGDTQLEFTVWDYGGQEVFYTLHHLFLTRFGVYLLAFNLLEMLMEGSEKFNVSLESLRFWLDSTKMHAPSTPVVLVGTFLDQIRSSTVLSVISKSLRVFLKDHNYSQVKFGSEYCFFPIDNVSGEGVEELKRAIDTLARQQKHVHMKIPVRWLSCLDEIEREADATSSSYLKLQDVQNLAKTVGIVSMSEVEAMLRLLHELGLLIRLSGTVNLRSYVVINQQWLVDQLSKIIRDPITHNDSFSERIKSAGLSCDYHNLHTNALITHDLIEFLWNDEMVEFLVDLMRETMLLSDWGFGDGVEKTYLIPSLISGEKQVIPKRIKTSCRFDFSEFSLPTGVFQRLVCLCVNQSSRKPSVNRSPSLFESSCCIWLGPSRHDCFWLENDSRFITAHVENDNLASECFSLVQSCLRKIKYDVMGNDFSWTTSFSTPSSPGVFKTPEETAETDYNPWILATVGPVHETEGQNESDLEKVLGEFLNQL